MHQPKGLSGISTPETFFKPPASLLMNLLLGYKLPLHFQHLQYVKLALSMQNILGIKYY